MAIRVIDDTKLQTIAAAIQSKDGGGTMTVDEMPVRIEQNLQSKAVTDSLIDKSITSIESDTLSVGDFIFRSCRQLVSAIFPNAASVNIDAFRECPYLTNIEIPNAAEVKTNCFYGDVNLPRIFLQSTTYLAANSFNNCPRLTAVIMGQRATLENTNTFSRADNAIIYVQPNDLSWYETATNWSTLYTANRIKSVAELSGDNLTWYQQQLAKYPAEEE